MDQFLDRLNSRTDWQKKLMI